MRIWDDIITDLRGVLSWSVGKQGDGLTVFEVLAAHSPVASKCPARGAASAIFEYESQSTYVSCSVIALAVPATSSRRGLVRMHLRGTTRRR
jgi:hypothetical protein